MKRPFLLSVAGVAGAFLLLGAGYVIWHLQSPPDYRLVHARALLDTENYLAALHVLRDMPLGARQDAETHSYLGAAYLRLHLYRAAVREFQEAVRQSPDALDPRVGLAST